MPRTRELQWTRGAALIAAAIVMTACKEAEYVSECPHYWSVAYDSGPGADTNVAPLSGHIRDVPEYHDCQRLMERPGAYGALAAVFASATLSNLEADLAANPGSAVAAATVLGINDQFAQLGIAKGGNCLYMWRPTPATWAAKIVPVPDNGSSCVAPVNPSVASGTDLMVSTTPAAGPPESPWVARFQYADGAHHIGLRCGPDWCTIGRTAASPTIDVADAPGLNGWLAGLPGETPGETDDPVTFAQLLSLARSPGWADAQFLAPAGGGNAPSGLWAVVIPSPKLDNLGPGDFSRWRVTGLVYIPATAPTNVVAAYTQRFNYALGWNAILMCDGSVGAAACYATESAKPTCPAVNGAGQVRWYGRIQPFGAAARDFCVLRRPHAMGDVIPGTARWRWVKGDETVWEGCPHGCCEVEGET